MTDKEKSGVDIGDVENGIHDSSIIGRDKNVQGDEVQGDKVGGDKNVYYAPPPKDGGFLSADALKLLLTMDEVSRRDGVRSLDCIENPSPRQVARWDYEFRGVPENEPLTAEDILGGAMDELLEADLVRETNKISYLLLPGGIERAKTERVKKKKRRFIEAFADLQAVNQESYIKAESIAKKLSLDLEETQDYLELMTADGFFEISRTFGGISVSLSSRGRMASKDPDFW